MKYYLMMTISLMLVFGNPAQAKPRCKSGKIEVSCEGVEGAQRKAFCAKKEPKKEKRIKLCQKAKLLKGKKKAKAKKNSEPPVNKDSEET